MTAQQPELLAQWLQQRLEGGEPDAPPPEGLDPEVVEAVDALRPDLVPVPEVDLDALLDELLAGPLAGVAGEDERAAAEALARALDAASPADPDALGDHGYAALAALQPEALPVPELDLDALFSPAPSVEERARAALSPAADEAAPAVALPPSVDPTLAAPQPPANRRRWLLPALSAVAMAATVLVFIAPLGDTLLTQSSPFPAATEALDAPAPSARAPEPAARVRPEAEEEPVERPAKGDEQVGAPRAVAKREAAPPPPPAAGSAPVTTRADASTAMPDEDAADVPLADQGMVGQSQGLGSRGSGLGGGGSAQGIGGLTGGYASGEATGSTAGRGRTASSPTTSSRPTSAPASAPAAAPRAAAQPEPEPEPTRRYANTGDLADADAISNTGAFGAAEGMLLEDDEASWDEAANTGGAYADPMTNTGGADLDAVEIEEERAQEAAAPRGGVRSARRKPRRPLARAEKQKSAEAPAAPEEAEAPRDAAPAAADRGVDLDELRSQAWGVRTPRRPTSLRAADADAYRAFDAARSAGDVAGQRAALTALTTSPSPEVVQDASLQLARLAVAQGRPERALAFLARGLGAVGGSAARRAQLYAFQGEIFEQRGDLAGARASYQRAIMAR